MPKQINAGKLTQALQRAFGFKGRYVPMLDEVVVPVYVIEDPAPAAVTRLCAGSRSFSPLIDADLAYVQLRNPVNSGVIINLTSVVVIALTAVKQDVEIRVTEVEAPEAGNNSHFRDLRNSGPGLARKPSGDIRRDTQPGATVGDLLAIIQIDGALAQTAAWQSSGGDPRQPLAILPPGTALLTQIQATALMGDSFVTNFRWLEIPITEQNPDGGLP